MSRSRPLAIVACVALGGALLVGASPAESAAGSPRVRELSASGAWSWFGDPRAVYHEGAHRRTYVGWVDHNGHIRVASYDHDTQVRRIATLKADFQIDDHANPSLLMRPDGHLMVFWSAHSGSTMFYRRSANPEDVSSWGPERTVPTNTAGVWGYTYPNPVQLSAEGNRIWLFWRGGNFNPTFSTSGDGRTWAPARTLISVPGQRPYLKVASDGVDEIHFAFTQAHPRNLTTNIYYARYKAGSLAKADGTVIAPITGAPITPAQADLVYDAATNGGAKAWVHDVAIDPDGRPVIVFATFPTDADHRYHYARWDGARWVDRELVAAGGSISGDPREPNYSGGITLDHEDPSRLYLSRQVNGVFEIEVWQTNDGGASWTARPVTTASGRGNYRPVSPRGQAGPDLDVIWMRGGYPAYTRYDTTIDVEALTQDVISPAAAELGAKQLQVIASDGGGRLIRKAYAGDGVWGGWKGLGRGSDGHDLGPPSVTSSAPGRLDVVTVDEDTGHLLYRFSRGGVWGAWSDRGPGPDGHRVAAPTVTSWGLGRLDVFARDAVTSELLHWWFDGSRWHGPERLAASPGGAFAPTAAAWAPRRLDVFTVDDRGRLLHAWFDGSRWRAWEDLGAAPGGAAYAAPAAVTAWGERRLDVFAPTSGGRSMAHRWFDGTRWRGPEILPAGTGPDKPLIAGMAATSWAPRRLDVFTTDARRLGLLHTWFDGSRWRGPERLDFGGTPSAILADPNPRTTPIPVAERIRDLGSD